MRASTERCRCRCFQRRCPSQRAEAGLTATPGRAAGPTWLSWSAGQGVCNGQATKRCISDGARRKRMQQCERSHPTAQGRVGSSTGQQNRKNVSCRRQAQKTQIIRARIHATQLTAHRTEARQAADVAETRFAAREASRDLVGLPLVSCHWSSSCVHCWVLAVSVSSSD